MKERLMNAWGLQLDYEGQMRLKQKKSRGTIQLEEKHGGRRVILREKDRICLP